MKIELNFTQILRHLVESFIGLSIVFGIIAIVSKPGYPLSFINIRQNFITFIIVFIVAFFLFFVLSSFLRGFLKMKFRERDT